MRKGPVISDQQGEHLTASSHGEHFSVASDTLVSDIQDTADALEEADGRLQVKLMVYSAVLKGILSAVEVDGREPKASGKSNPSVLKAKTEDITDGLLISMLHEEEEELIKLVENNHLKRRRPALENVKKELTNGDTNLPEATENYRDNQKKALQDAYFLVHAVSLSVQTLKQEALLMSAKLQGCVNVAAECPDMEVEDPGYDLESRHIFESLHEMLQRVVKDIHLVGDYVAGQQNKEIQSRPVLNRWRPPEEAAKGKLGSFAPGFDFYAQDNTTLDERVVGEDMQTLFRADTAISHLKQKLVHGKSKSHFGHLGGEVLSSDLKEQFTRRYSDNHLQEFSEQVIEVPEHFSDDDLLGRSNSVAEQGSVGEPRLGREKSISEKEIMVNLQENAWKIQVENSIILSVLDGLSRTWHQSQTKRSEVVQSERDEAPCSRSMVPELQKELTSGPPNVSDGRTPPQAEGQEQLPDIKVSSPRARFESQVGRPQQQYVEGSLETANLVRNLKAGLLARIGAEKERAERLLEALVDQQWKSEVELDIFTTLLWEGSADNGSMRSVNEPLDCRETQPYQRHGEEPRDQRADMSCDASDSTKRVPNELSETSSLAYGEGESGRTDEGLSNGQEVPQSDPGAIKVLERQNAELRRENEKLAERQTDEIYTLKREFYRELDKVQRQLRQLDPESSQRSGTEASLAQRALSDLKMVWTKKMQDEIAQDLKSGGSRASETAGLSRVGSSKYEKNPVGIQQSGDFLPSLVSALDKEGDLEPTCSRVRNSPAASLSGEVVDNTAHTSEMNETIAQDTRTVNEDVVNESSASKEVESSPVEGPKSGSCASSGHEASNLGSEETFEGSPSADAGKKIQTKGSVSKQLDEDPNQRLNFNLRDRETQTHELHFQGVGTPTSSSVDCLSSTQDLQKAETEVDMLGDEVDSLMDLLEKVYYVLNHYAPIIQCYPGIADLLALVRQEVFQRIQES